jgi:uncharacterized linocin/CFP29 family protein
MSNHLLRSHAPLSDHNWATIDDEARQRLGAALAARKLVDFIGPLGWSHSATNLGRVGPVAETPCSGVTAAQRRVLPLVEVRATFTLRRSEMSDDDRGAADADLEPLDGAAHDIAVTENRAVFEGWSQASITGIAQGSPHQGLTLPGQADGYRRPVAVAVEQLLASGIEGPYGLALGSEAYTRVSETAEHGGITLRDHLAKILGGGPLVWAPGIQGAVVMSLRGEDFLFESGQDLSVGYLSHDAETVTLYLEESFSFHVATPEAAVALKPAA